VEEAPRFYVCTDRRLPRLLTSPWRGGGGAVWAGWRCGSGGDVGCPACGCCV